MSSAIESQPGTQTDLIDVLRRFHFGEPAACAATQPPGDAILPALLSDCRDSSGIRYPYPLYIGPAGAAPDAPLTTPLGEHFAQSVAAFAPGDDDARILKDNLPWLERYLRQHLTGADPVDAPSLYRSAAQALQEHLQLREGSREKLEADLDRLGATMVPGSTFLAYGSDTPLHLLVHAIRCRDLGRREDLAGEIRRKLQALEALLRIEAGKSGQPGTAADQGNGGVARLLDTDALAGMLQKRTRGSVSMQPQRRARIEQALATLRAFRRDPVQVRFVGRLANPWFRAQENIEVIESKEPCADAGRVFEQEASRFATLFAALRIAALEIDDRYDAAIHDSWFASFDWQAFTDRELQLVTRVVALVPANHLAGDGLPSFSRLLGSRQPVHVISWIRAYDNPAVRPGEGPFDTYRFELAYFGVGHRQAVVTQTSAARHQDLLDGFFLALDSNRTSLHLVNRGTQTLARRPMLDPWFVASAALESRAHPFLLVDPGAGDRAAERVRFDGNPQPEADWPTETLHYADHSGKPQDMKLAFTFADYALLMPALHDHFRVVPADFDSDDLVPVAEFLDRDDDAAERLVPFVLGMDAEQALIRLVVSRALVFACRDRLNYWHTLQELAGVHNLYVEAAVERVLEDSRAAIAAEQDKLMREHEQEIESVRSAAAGEAMGQLVDVLMGADLSGVVAISPAASMPAAETVPATRPDTEVAADAAAAEQVVAAVEEDEPVFDEPWLDSASCTTCDDCMNINKMMFAYNENKQAYLKDPRAGTYADLVAAAEKCPAKCIHPGKPLDPAEPGLEELIARAAPYN